MTTDTTARIALASFAAFALCAIAVHFLRPDLDGWATPLSFYLVGAHGAWLKAAYVALATGTAALAIGLHRALEPAARSAAPTLLFLVAACGIVATALADTDLPRHDATFEGYVHGNAARTAFLGITAAMLLQSWRFRGDARWRARFAPAFGLAALAFALLWVHTLWRGSPRGLGQKLVVALVVAWLVTAAVWLLRSARNR